MRILFAIHTPKDPKTAVYAYVRARADDLAERGHRTEIVAPPDLLPPRWTGARWLPLSFPVALLRWLRRQEPPVDLAVFHSFSGWATLLCRRRRGRGRLRRLVAVTQFHGLEPLHYRAMRDEAARAGRPFRLRFRLFQEAVMPALLRLACRRSDLVLGLNRSELRFLAERRWAAPERLALAGGAVDPAFFAAERGPAAEASTLLFLGQWLPGKGTRYLAAAFAELAIGRPGLRLVCLGTRVEPEEVAAGFPEPLRAAVRAVREVERAEVPGWLARSDVFVFPSLAEGSSLALLEAMAAGTPIVATAVGAAPDLLADGENALLVPPADSAALAAAVRRLLADAGLRERLGRGARRAAEPFRWERQRDIYAGLLEGAGRRAPSAPETAA